MSFVFSTYVLKAGAAKTKFFVTSIGLVPLFASLCHEAHTVDVFTDVITL